jgi:hypothetical protein
VTTWVAIMGKGCWLLGKGEEECLDRKRAEGHKNDVEGQRHTTRNGGAKEEVNSGAVTGRRVVETVRVR